MIDFNIITQLVLETGKFFDKGAEKIIEKGQFDYVTNIDYNVQDFLYNELSQHYPNVKMLSEEIEGFVLNDDVSSWILDPVDGTTNLMHGYRESAVSLALFSEGIIKFGCIFNPFTNEFFKAEHGKGAYLNGKLMRCSNTSEIKKSLISIETAPYNREEADINFHVFKEVFLSCHDIRCSGSSALDIAYLACGRIDAFFAMHLKPWDYAAGSIILNEAGGKISDWNGASLKFNENCNILASNKKIHSCIVAYLKHNN